MKVDHVPGYPPHRAAPQENGNAATQPTPPTGADDDDAVEVALSPAAKLLLDEIPGKSVAHRARLALAEGLIEPGQPFGHAVREIAKGADPFAAASQPETDAPEAPNTASDSEDGGATAETGTTPNPDSVTDPELALIAELADDLSEEDAV